MRRLVPASVALSSLFVLLAISVSAAQINGAPASVTSPGFGGRAVNGTPSSVTSLGPQGYSPRGRATFSGSAANPRVQHRHRLNGQYYPPAVYAVPVPYAVDPGEMEDSAADENDANYQGGPTIFDRRGAGAASYVPPKGTPQLHTLQADDDPQEVSASAPDPTVLVFKDGHTVEVGNYAIVGATLFDLTSGHHRKVALADLDLDATRRQNDDRGVTFQLPLSPQAN
jgi:hypothetical protein